MLLTLAPTHITNPRSRPFPADPSQQTIHNAYIIPVHSFTSSTPTIIPRHSFNLYRKNKHQSCTFQAKTVLESDLLNSHVRFKQKLF